MEFGWKSALAICLGLLLAAAPARADETAGESKPVVEEILDILRSRNQISEQEHTELLERARGEDVGEIHIVCCVVWVRVTMHAVDVDLSDVGRKAEGKWPPTTVGLLRRPKLY